jgi:cell wall-associated NlpC family hydrolase
MLPYWFVKGTNKLLDKLQIFPVPLFFVWGSTSYKVKGDHARYVLDTLRAGDVLLRRYDRYVTSRFIPGWWKHAAIYVGDGKVIHALGHGVVEEDILTFLRCDYVAILRAPAGQKRRATQVIPDRARELLGKEYDFAFDTGDDERFYCTEVVRKCYHDFDNIVFEEKASGLSKGAVLPDYLPDSGLEIMYSSTWEQS